VKALFGYVYADQMRRALQQAPVTRYRISKDTGIDQSVLCRFWHGGGISAENAFKLNAYLQRTPTPGVTLTANADAPAANAPGCEPPP